MTLNRYSAVVRLDTKGQLSLVAGNGIAGFSGDGGPAALAELSGPTGVVVDASGNLYIEDAGNNRIRVVSNGTITTVAVVSGAASPGGTLSPLPAVAIGGVNAVVLYAGLAAAGEFQFNVVVPPSADNGDQSIVVTYGGRSTQPGTSITITGGT